MLCQLSYASNVKKPCCGNHFATAERTANLCCHLEEDSTGCEVNSKGGDGSPPSAFSANQGFRNEEKRRANGRCAGEMQTRICGEKSEGKRQTAADAALVLGKHQNRAVGEDVWTKTLGEQIVHVEHYIEAACRHRG